MTMGPLEFQTEMNRLGAVFTPLDEKKLDIYYDEFKMVHPQTIREAVRILIGQHPYRRFPFPAEIWSAIAAVRKKAAERRYAEEAREQLGVCAVCLGDGWKKIPDKFINGIWYPYVTYCDCRIGQRMKAAQERRAKMAARENPQLNYPEVPGVVPDPEGMESTEDDLFKEEKNDEQRNKG